MDRDSCDDAVACHYAQVLRGLMAVAGERERAEDALHDALVAAMKPGVIESIERPDAWLYAVGIRKLRRAAWRRRLDVLLGANAGNYAEPDLAAIEASELLSNLTPRQREIVVARYYLDLTFKEIGASFGITVSAATSTVSQALERIRRKARDSE